MTRVTQNMLARGTMDNLQRSLARTARLQEQLSTGRQLNRPSDSPSGLVTSMQSRSALARTEQHLRNADNATGWLDTADSALQGSVTMLQRDGQDGFFVPFRDATSGTESYPAGRYIDLEPDAVDRTTWTVHLDFNYAYSPSCAYDDRFSCPLPPPENWLQVPIRAGEKVWKPT